MKRFSRMFFAGLGIVIAASAISLLPQKTATASNVGSVQVVNTPLPVQGTVGVNNFPATQAISGNVGINGTPTVQVTGMPTVQLTPGAFGNTPSTPIYTRDIDNPALAPFSQYVDSGSNSSFPVDANHRLVIENVSATCFDGTPVTFIGASLTTTAGGKINLYSFPASQTVSGTNFVLNQQTRIYADPGTTVQFSTIYSNGGDIPFCSGGTVSGYLVTP